MHKALLAVKDDQKMDRLAKKLQELSVEEQNEDNEEDEDIRVRLSLSGLLLSCLGCCCIIIGNKLQLGCCNIN